MTQPVTQDLRSAAKREEGPGDESSLVRGARADPTAFARLYDRYVRTLYKYLLGKTGNVAEYETILVNPVPFPDPPPQGGSSGHCADFPGCFYTSTGLTPNAENHYRLAVGGLEYSVQGSWSLSFELQETAP